jgi:hypothetical protein
MFPDQHPGVFSHLQALEGQGRDGRPAQVTPTGATWSVSYADGTSIEGTLTEIANEILEGRFQPTAAVVRPNLAEALYKAAVWQAQESTVALWRAQTGQFEESDDPDDDAEAMTGAEAEADDSFEIILVWTYLERASFRALMSVVFAVATAEAQLNTWSLLRGGWSSGPKGDEDRLDPAEKVKALTRKWNKRIDYGDPAWSWFCEAVANRHGIVHSKPEVERVPIGGGSTVGAERETEKARRACLGVRGVLIAVAKAMGVEPPRYLAMAPPGDPADPRPWATAVVLTGVRDDPDFPKTTEWLKQTKRATELSERLQPPT